MLSRSNDQKGPTAKAAPDQGSHDWSFSRRSTTLNFLNALALQPSSKVLAVGIGEDHHFGVEIALHGHTVLGVDSRSLYYRHMVSSEQQARIASNNGSYLVARKNFLELEAPEVPYDAVFLLKVLDDPNTRNPADIVRKAFFEVKTGGVLVFSYLYDQINVGPFDNVSYTALVTRVANELGNSIAPAHLPHSGEMIENDRPLAWRVLKSAT